MSTWGGGSKRDWSGPASLAVGLMAVAGGNVLFHLGTGRLLGAEEYSSLSALLTALLALAIPAGAIQVALTADIARIHRNGRSVGFGPMVTRFSIAGGAIAIGVLAFSPWLGAYLRIEGVTPMALVGAFFVPALAGLVLRSVLLGREQYGLLAAVLVGGTTLRLVLGIAVLTVMPTAVAALAVTLVSETLTTVALLVAARAGETAERRLVWNIRLAWGELVGGIAAFVGFWLLLGSDAILARHQLQPSEAGAYAASTLAAKFVLYAPQSIVTAAIPRYALGGAEGRRALVDSMLSAMAFGLVGVVGVVFLGPPLLSGALGGSFVLSQAALAHLATAALWAGALTALINYHLAQGAVVRANVAWVGVGILLVGGHFATRSVTLSLAVLVGVLVSGLLASTPIIRIDRRATGFGPTGEADVDLTVVVPVLNEAERVLDVVDDVQTAFADQLVTLEIIVVDDGSSDATSAVVASLDDPRVRLITHEHNQGKGAALRSGMARARGSLIGFIDGDGELDARHLVTLASVTNRFDSNGAVGSKRHPDSGSNRQLTRRIVSAASRVVVGALFASPVADTQVGAKVFRREMVADVLPRTRETGYLFDLEFLVIGAQRGWNHVVDCPVQIASGDTSTVGPRAIARSARDVLSLAARTSRSPRAGSVPAVIIEVPA